jgi:pyruvate dehydrogenase E2 component (dihydrolipoamide acetyltransferase)
MSITELILPRTSDAMSEAVLTSWLVEDESIVAKGDVVAEVETDKAMVEVLAEGDGLLVLAVPAGASVEVGGVLAYLLSEADIQAFQDGQLDLTRHMGAPGEIEEPSAPVVEETPVSPPVQEQAPRGRDMVSSPLARKMAREAGLDLRTLTPGSGHGGRIVRADVEAAVERQSDGHIMPLTPRQRSMAQAMTLSMSQIPHFTVTRDVVIDRVMELRRQMKDAELAPPSLSAFFLRALAIAMRDTPVARLTWTSEGIRTHTTSAIGLAIADGDTDLVVPVIREAELKSLSQVGKEITDSVEAVRDKRLSPDRLRGAIGTISNLGMYGIDSLSPIIPPDQTFIIGIGRSRNSLVLDDHGQLRQESNMTVTLAGDHRVMTGLAGARLLDRFAFVCQNPVVLIESGSNS